MDMDPDTNKHVYICVYISVRDSHDMLAPTQTASICLVSFSYKPSEPMQRSLSSPIRTISDY